MPPRRPSRRPLLAALTAATLAAGGIAAAAALPATWRPGVAAAPGAAALGLPPVKHVWIVALENKSYAQSFGTGTQAPYLFTLAKQGALLEQYYGTAHFSLPNYIALVSGQGPNPALQADCPPYADFVGVPGGPDGQAVGQGCVFPASVKTVADQLTAKGLGWRGYMEDLGNDPARESAACGAPTVKNGSDDTQSASAKDQYAARHNPFVYFHSLTDGACKGHVFALPQLAKDVASSATAPAYAFITPNLCNDGHDSAHCVGTDVNGGHAYGLSAVDLWLRRYVPVITGSAAYKDGGLLIVTWDEAGTGVTAGTSSGAADGKADASSCCDERVVNTPLAAGATGVFDINGSTSPSGTGGGRVGAIVLSPFVTPGTVSTRPYNHYSLLRTVEDLYGLPHLGYAAQSTGVNVFGSDLFNAGGTTPVKQPIRTPANTPTRRPTTTPPPTVTPPGRGLAATGLETLLPWAGLTLLAGAVAARRRRSSSQP